MVFANSGKNRIRDLLDTDLNHGQLGTDSTTPAATQTALLAADSTTSLAVTTTTADKQINIDYNLPATTGNGTSFSEIGIFNSGDSLFSRNIFTSLTKTSTEQWQISVVYKIL